MCKVNSPYECHSLALCHDMYRVPCRYDMYIWFYISKPLAWQSSCHYVMTCPEYDVKHHASKPHPFGQCWGMSSSEDSLTFWDQKVELTSVENFICILQRCRKAKDLAYAKRIHEHIRSSGLETHKVLGNHIVQVFVESGSVPDAQQVFDRLVQRNVLSWTSLISGYISCGQVYHAFDLYHEMQEDNVHPSSYTLVALLRACTKLKDIKKGAEFHVKAVQKGFERDPFVASALVDMYAKCGLLPQAQEAFDKLSVRDVVLWNALIVGYTEHGTGHEALRCYEQMQLENVCLTPVTFLGLLKACSKLRALEKGWELHTEVARRALENVPFVGSTLVDMYVKCGSLLDAKNVFDGLPFRSVVPWNALIAGYADHGHGEEVLKCFEQMQSVGVSQDAVTFVYGLKACGSIGNIGKGREMHTEITQKGFERDPYLGSTLLNMYAKCGSLAEAQEVFDKLLARDVVSWTALIAGYAQHGPDHKALESFDQMHLENVSPNAVTFACILKACSNFEGLGKGQKIHVEVAEEGHEVDFLVNSALVDMYAKQGLLSEAQDVFDTMSKRDLVSWNALLAGYVEHDPVKGLNCFEQIQLDGVSPDAVTFACALKACGNLKAIDKGRELNMKILLTGYEDDKFIGSMLVDMYTKCNSWIEAWEIFDKLSGRDVIVWSALIAGLREHGSNQEALSCFEQMQLENIAADHGTYADILKACSSIGAIDKGQKIHTEVLQKGYERDLFVGSSLVDLYAKCGFLPEAWVAFMKLPVRDVVLWNALLAGYTDNGFGQEALVCLQMMQLESHSPSAVTLVCILKACGSIGAIDKLQETHMEITQKGFEQDLLVGNTLVDTYGRCGCLLEAQEVFDTLSVRDVASWNAVIKGLGMNHEGSMAVQYFKDMQGTGVKPDATTFTCLLTACSRASLVFEGQDLFKVMREEFGILPTVYHFICMVDLLARSGCLHEAEKLIETLPCFPSKDTWTTLLSASKTYEETELGSRCFQQLVHSNAGFAAPYVLMANLCSSVGRWEGVYTIEELRKQKQAFKRPGSAWIEVNKKVHEFVVDDTPSKEMSVVLGNLTIRMEEQGYVPNLDLVLRSISE